MDEMNLRLAVRETALKVKNMAIDISENLKKVSEKIDAGNKDEISQYLDASRLFLQNLQNQMNNV